MIIILFCRINEWSRAPLHLANVLCLLLEVAPRWCNDNLLHKSYETVGSLAWALSIALDTSEVELWLAIKRLLLRCDPDIDALVDFWPQSHGTPMTRYLSVCFNVGSPVDGLFMWLASFALSVHLNVIHRDGVWTIRRTAVPDFCNPAIVFVLGYYMAAPACQQLQVSPHKKSAKIRGWLDYHASLPDFVPYPCVLNGPVKSPDECCEDLGLQMDRAVRLIQELLEALAGPDYCADLVPWLQMHQSTLEGPRWLSACGLDFD